ncbi:uncharacterized protein LOC119394835 [Rhipicephalus sanguineus]|uniref:uncharacterized protein LOC119394835 n=1 Tax=Rhipicephalus sanguineus TaxID=34632 RepID=UPI0018938664|nr:uncharacterized protein LOC119394835 [Rhipicephalus sanguineus]
MYPAKPEHRARAQTPPSWKHTAPPSCYSADPPADSSPEEARLASSPLPSFPAAADVTRSPQKKAASSLGTAKTAAATLVPIPATTDTMESTVADEQVIPPDAAAKQAMESAGKGKQPPSQHAVGAGSIPSCVMGTLAVSDEDDAFPSLPSTGAPPGTPLCAPLVPAPPRGPPPPKAKPNGPPQPPATNTAEPRPSPKRARPTSSTKGPVETALFRPRSRINFRTSTQEAISSLLAAGGGRGRARSRKLSPERCGR